MSLRGSRVIDGHITTKEYITIAVSMLGVKILKSKEANRPEPNNNNGDRVNNIVHLYVYDG